jgi:formylglycine-generating enzyme required for sulfatase activity
MESCHLLKSGGSIVPGLGRGLGGGRSLHMRSLSSTGRVVGTLSALLLAAVAVAHPPGDPRPLPAGAVAAGATVTREAGIEFVTIPLAGRQPGQANPGWAGNGTPGDVNVGRGSVGYEFRIGRYEVSAGQWSEFLDAVSRVPGGVPFVGTGQAGVNNSMLPRGNISWRRAAIYCNWLHNNKGTTLDAFTSGAYNVSTFGFHPSGIGFSDQLTRSPGARFFIPSLDEWIKAAHYDPSRLETPITTNTAGGAGYWLYPTTSDTAPIGGPPGQLIAYGPTGFPFISPTGQPTQSNSGWDAQRIPGFSPFSIPLGAYTAVMSPWGLFDTSGGTAEWTEEARGGPSGIPEVRSLRGSAWNDAPGTARASDLLAVNGNSNEWPGFGTFDFGLRVAALVPAPACGALFLAIGIWGFQRRRHT